jgi:hypothetical protein
VTVHAKLVDQKLRLVEIQNLRKPPTAKAHK